MFFCVFGPLCLGAQSILDRDGQPQAANTLLLGVGTSTTYDSNAGNTQVPTPLTQYVVSPEFGLQMTHARWQLSATYIPGLSYSNSSSPMYQSVSQIAGISLQYNVTPRLSLGFQNSLVYSTNPFDSLQASTILPQVGQQHTANTATWDYLPKTNEQFAATASYSLSPRSVFTLGTGYQYVSYTGNSGSSQNLLFPQSTSGQVSLGLTRNFGPRLSSGGQYMAERLDSGNGQIITESQTMNYVVRFAAKPNLLFSGSIGPQYVRTDYLLAGTGSALISFLNANGTGWSWTGGANLTWTGQRSSIVASLTRQLSLGNQYQGNTRLTAANLQFQYQLPKRMLLDAFAGYNINQPLFSTNSNSRFSNNYLSTGAGLSRKLSAQWTIGLAYWYLAQNQTASAVQNTYYSGNHNRVALSLSYLIAKPIRR